MKTTHALFLNSFLSQRNLLRIGILAVVAALLAVPLYRASSASRDRKTSANRAISTPVGSQDTTPRAVRLPISALFSMSPVMAGPVIETLDGTCTNPQTNWNLGNVVCARVTGAASLRIAFVDPSGFIRQISPISSSPDDITFTLPATQTSTINEQIVDNRGTWRINVIANRGFVLASASIVVSDPDQAAADLVISKTVTADNEVIPAGSTGVFQIFVSNAGPDSAQNVVVTDVLPSNTTFVAITQTSGPAFNCTGTGPVICTIASFARCAKASFDLSFSIDGGTAPGAHLDNTATIASDTSDPDSTNNSSTASVTVATTGAANCTLTCPGNISASADTTDSNGVEGTVVHFSTPTGESACGNITVDHCNDCFFPIGSTVVSADADSGDSCTFTVTVTSANAPNISCPSSISVNADSDCEATVNLGNPTVSGGQNVTVSVSRSDGKPMYNCDSNGENCTRKNPDVPFPAGVTTVTWTATSHDSSGNELGNASCTQTVTVNDVTPPVIGATNQTISVDANCQAVVPDYSSTVTDNCACDSSDTTEACFGHPHVVVTQTPAPGTVVGPGTYTVHITANDGSSNNNGAGNTSTKDITLTVVDSTPPTFTFVPPAVTAYTGPGATSCDTVVSNATLGTATATDNCGTVTVTRSPSGNTFPVGTTTVTWTATDGAGNTTTATQTVTVIDNTAPVITVSSSVPSMWPPNHKYQTFQLTSFVTGASDNCGGVGVSDVVIEKVTSDEIENGNGDGNTTNDIVIAANCRSVQLRSEREGNGDGRVYTITFKVTDTHGNVGRATSTVIVRHNPGETAVDSGVHYTVNGTCP